MARRAILLVDTDDAVADALRAVTDADTCRIIAAGDVDTALGFLLQRRPALAMVNVDLDRGWRLCAEMRSDERFVAIPLIIVSAVASQEVFYQHQEFPTRADAYLHKPLDREELGLAVDGLVDHVHGDPVEDDDLVIFERREDSRLDIALDGMDFGAGSISAAPQRLPTHPEMGEIVQALQARIAQLEARLADAAPDSGAAAGGGVDAAAGGVVAQGGARSRSGGAPNGPGDHEQARRDLDSLRRLDRELDAARRRAGLTPRAPVREHTGATPGWARLRGRTIPPEDLARMGITSQAVKREGRSDQRRAAEPPFGTRAPTNPPFGTRAPTNPPFGTRAPTNPPFGTQAPTNPPFGSRAATNPSFGTRAPTNPPFGTGAASGDSARGQERPPSPPPAAAAEPAWKRLRGDQKPAWSPREPRGDQEPSAVSGPPLPSASPPPRAAHQRPVSQRPVPAWMALRAQGGADGPALAHPEPAPPVPAAGFGAAPSRETSPALAPWLGGAEQTPPAPSGGPGPPEPPREPMEPERAQQPQQPQELAPASEPVVMPAISGPATGSPEPSPPEPSPPAPDGEAKATAQGMPPLRAAAPGHGVSSETPDRAVAPTPPPAQDEPALGGASPPAAGRATGPAQAPRAKGKTRTLGSSQAAAGVRPRRRVSGRHRVPAPPRPGAAPPPLPPDVGGGASQPAPRAEELASCLAGLREDCEALEASAILDARGRLVEQDLPVELQAVELAKLAAAAVHARAARGDGASGEPAGASPKQQLIHPLRAGVTVVTPVTTPSGEQASLVTLHRRGPRLDRDLRAARRAAARIHALI